jgi:hypothetical protein
MAQRVRFFAPDNIGELQRERVPAPRWRCCGGLAYVVSAARLAVADSHTGPWKIRAL